MFIQYGGRSALAQSIPEKVAANQAIVDNTELRQKRLPEETRRLSHGKSQG
jgi:hypothetical protein